MTISHELKAKILRYHHVEKWRVGTIASQLNVHHTTVKRVLSETGVDKNRVLVQKSMIDPFLPFVFEQLKRFPNLTASRLYGMVVERGYPGGQDHFRHLISFYRPKTPAEAYLRLRTLAGEQAQIDWGHFGHISIGDAKRALMAFVMVLSYSRKVFLRFYLNARTDNFLRGHEQAFNYFQGVPRVALYDNLKSAVLDRQGDAVRFNPTLLAFAAHYHFEPRPCAVYRGNEKGRVERTIRYIRDNFFAARHYSCLDDLNQQALTWCDTSASSRPCPEDKSKTVQVTFLAEQPRLIKLPDNPYPCDEVETVSIGKTPYARFDLNDYSVPHTHVRKKLVIRATLDCVSILDGSTVIAKHTRSYDKAKQIECEEHLKSLASQKAQARLARGQDRLSQSIDCGREFLESAATHGYAPKSISKQLTVLLDDYGAYSLNKAMRIALEKNVPHPNSVRLILQKHREDAQEQPLATFSLSQDKRVTEMIIKPHSLNQYDVLNEQTIPEEEHNDL
jgi:transposase